MGKKTWTDAMKKRLRVLVSQGKTAQECGDAMGITRHSAGGMLDRLNLTLKGTRPRLSPEAKAQKTSRMLAQKARGVIRRAGRKPRPSMPPGHPVGEPRSLKLPLDALHDRVCHYPHGNPAGLRNGAGDFSYCGHPIPEVNFGLTLYCPFHERLTHRPG